MAGLTKDDYQKALDAQPASNLSGIVHSFHQIVLRVWEEAEKRDKGTNWVNAHPICILFVEQIMHLSCGRNMGAYTEAYRICTKEAEV